MSTHPALVVGIGRAGCEILSAIDEFVSAQGAKDQFQFLAIDSSGQDLHTFAPDAATTYELTIDRAAYNRDRDCESFRYLQAEPTFVPEAGTSRWRPLGRYLIDSDADSTTLYECLSTQIAALSERSSPSTTRHVWVINSLGGGTGSGAFPLVTLLLQRCSQEFEASIDLFGLGSLPRLDRLEDQLDIPEGEPVHYANAYTALAELRRLMDLDGETTYPIEIDIDASSTDITRSSLSVDHNPFEGYWLLGFDETAQFDGDYVSRMNRVAAQLVFYLASTESTEWFRQGHLYSVDGISVETPFEELKRYHTLDQELNDIDDELGTLRDQRDALNTTIEWLDSLLRAATRGSLGSETEAGDHSNPLEDALPVGEELAAACEDLLATLPAPTDSEGSRTDRFEKRVAEIAESHPAEIPDHVPTKPAVEFLCAALLRKRVKREIATHPLPECLSKLQSKWFPEEEGRFSRPEVPEADPPGEDYLTEWRDTLLGKLRGRKATLHERVHNSLTPRFISPPAQQLAALEEDLERAEQLARDYEDLRTFEANLTDTVERSRNRLEDCRSHVEQKAKKKHEDVETVQQRWGRLSQQRSQLASSMQDPDRRDGTVRVPLQLETERTDRRLPDPNFTALLSDGVLSEDELRHSLEEAVTLLSEPVEDLAESQFGKTTGRLGLIVPDGDRSLFESLLREDGDTSGSLHRELYYYFEDFDRFVSGTQGLSLRLLGLYGPVSLEETSEFGTIHGHYTDPDSDLASPLGSLSDADVDERVAYPELFGE